MNEEGLMWCKSGVRYATWEALGVLPPKRTNLPEMNPRAASLVEKKRLEDEVAVRRADGRLPSPLAGHEYILLLDGLYVRAIRPEGLV